MPYIPDGQMESTHYGGSAARYSVTRVGWLDHRHPFRKGRITEEVRLSLLKLLPLVAKPARGFHPCPFCENPPTTIPVEVDGTLFRMGTAEIVVAGADGTLFSAPNLIYHYVTEHEYLPPDDFLQAVVEPGPLPAEIEASLRRR